MVLRSADQNGGNAVGTKKRRGEGVSSERFRGLRQVSREECSSATTAIVLIWLGCTRRLNSNNAPRLRARPKHCTTQYATKRGICLNIYFEVLINFQWRSYGEGSKSGVSGVGKAQSAFRPVFLYQSTQPSEFPNRKYPNLRNIPKNYLRGVPYSGISRCMTDVQHLKVG